MDQKEIDWIKYGVEPYEERSLIKVGSRVSRLVYLDDGTCNRRGDKCLADSPRKYGTVDKIYRRQCNPILLREPHIPRWETVIDVIFDDGVKHTFFPHGVDMEPETSGRLG